MSSPEIALLDEISHGERCHALITEAPDRGRHQSEVARGEAPTDTVGLGVELSQSAITGDQTCGDLSIEVCLASGLRAPWLDGRLEILEKLLSHRGQRAFEHLLPEGQFDLLETLSANARCFGLREDASWSLIDAA